MQEETRGTRKINKYIYGTVGNEQQVSMEKKSGTESGLDYNRVGFTLTLGTLATYSSRMVHEYSIAAQHLNRGTEAAGCRSLQNR